MEFESSIEPELSSVEEQTWGMLVHLSAFSLFFTGIGYLLGPLVLWLLKREESDFVDQQGKEVLNFQLNSTVYFVVMAAICFILNIYIFLYLLLITWMVVVIHAAQAANEGKSYRYPLTLRLIK